VKVSAIVSDTRLTPPVRRHTSVIVSDTITPRAWEVSDTITPRAWALFDGDGLCQVARLVDVQTAQACDPVGEQLQRDDREHGL
jgi:hypothetical protein